MAAHTHTRAQATEIGRFFPSLKYVKFHGSASERDLLLQNPAVLFGDVDVVITTYETVVAEVCSFLVFVCALALSGYFSEPLRAFARSVSVDSRLHGGRVWPPQYPSLPHFAP